MGLSVGETLVSPTDPFPDACASWLVERRLDESASVLEISNRKDVR